MSDPARRARNASRWRRVRRLLLFTTVLVGLGVIAPALVGYPRHDLPAGTPLGVWRGAYHVHTVDSDGRGTVDDVVREAGATGLRWVVITEHNRIVDAAPRYAGGVLLVKGVEVSTAWGHAVALGVPRALTRDERRSDTSLDLIHSMNGSIVASHPVGPRRPFTRLDTPQLDGIEVISGDTMWREVVRSPLRLMAGALALPLNRMHAAMQVVKRPDRGLEAWDRLLAGRRVTGFFSHDAHGVPSYELAFRLMSTYAIAGVEPTGDAEADARTLVEALVRGRTWFGLDAFAPAGAFDFHARTSDGRRVEMGDEVPMTAAPTLVVTVPFRELPDGLAVSIHAGGNVLRPEGRPSPNGLVFEHLVRSPGAYRVEVVQQAALAQLPWVLTNPIHVTGSLEP
jgi:hypothetical protein